MERIRPHNPIFNFCAPLMPLIVWNTYVEINEDQIIFSRYFQKKGRRRKRTDAFIISEVVSIGWPSELGISMQEEKQHGRYCGTYAAQEISFLLKSGEIIPFNAKPYTKKQCRELLNLFPCEKKPRISKALEL